MTGNRMKTNTPYALSETGRDLTLGRNAVEVLLFEDDKLIDVYRTDVPKFSFVIEGTARDSVRKLGLKNPDKSYRFETKLNDNPTYSGSPVRGWCMGGIGQLEASL